MKQRNFFKEETELLRKQLELLAERSKGAYEKDLAELSCSMCEIYGHIRKSRMTMAAIAAFPVVCAYLVVCFKILVKELFRRNA